MLVIHCSLRTKTTATSLTQELRTKPRTLLPWNAFGGWLRGSLKVRLQEADLLHCSSAKLLYKLLNNKLINLYQLYGCSAS